MTSKFVCTSCKSENVSQSAWVNINTEKLVDFVDESSFWCDSCQKETTPEKIFDWREAEFYEDGLDKYPIEHTPTKQEIQDTTPDTSFSIKHEGHLNRNNIIFHTNKYQKMVEKLNKVNDKLKKSWRKNGR
jgi:transcription elongation factor Elf1